MQIWPFCTRLEYQIRTFYSSVSHFPHVTHATTSVRAEYQHTAFPAPETRGCILLVVPLLVQNLLTHQMGQPMAAPVGAFGHGNWEEQKKSRHDNEPRKPMKSFALALGCR